MGVASTAATRRRRREAADMISFAIREGRTTSSRPKKCLNSQDSKFQRRRGASLRAYVAQQPHRRRWETWHCQGSQDLVVICVGFDRIRRSVSRYKMRSTCVHPRAVRCVTPLATTRARLWPHANLSAWRHDLEVSKVVKYRETPERGDVSVGE